jgi:hypothetical protein
VSLKDLLDNYANALTTISIVVSALVTLWITGRNYTQRSLHWRTIRQQLKDEVARVRGHRTLTSPTTMISTLLEEPGLWVEPRFVDAVETLQKGVLTLLPEAELRSVLFDATRPSRIAIVGATARGKSTFARKLFCDLALAYERGVSGYYPMFIDCSVDFLTPEQDDRSSVERGLGSEKINQIKRIRPRKIVLIMDGLDEVFYSPQRGGVSNVLRHLNISDNVVMFARPVTFAEFLKYNPQIAPTRTVQFEEYDVELLNLFAEAVLHKVFQVSDVQRARLLPALTKAISERVITAPLHLVLAVEHALSSSLNNSLSFNSLAQIYGRYVESLLQREIAATQHPLESHQVQEVLEHLCGMLVQRIPDGNTFHAPGLSFGVAEIRTACDAVLGPMKTSGAASPVTWIAARSILERESGSGLDVTRLRFSHPSFVDFFVARHILRRLESNPSRAADLLAVFMPLEVYSFLKLFFRLDIDARRGSRIIDVARVAVEQHIEDAQNGDIVAQLRIEQIIYITAHIRSSLAVQFVRKLALELPIPFVTRGAAIGLAYGGVEEDLHRYILQLEHEYEACTLGPHNTLNLIHHLAYFGDIATPFQGSPAVEDVISAAQTWSKLMDQLRSPLHVGSRILALYTLEVLVRTSQTNACLRTEARFVISPLSNLLSTDELRNDPTLRRRVLRLSTQLSHLQSQLTQESQLCLM